jgi:hypothetical protein
MYVTYFRLSCRHRAGSLNSVNTLPVYKYQKKVKISKAIPVTGLGGL